jgi:hypothetical protein
MIDVKEAETLTFNIGIDCEYIARCREMLPKLQFGSHKKYLARISDFIACHIKIPLNIFHRKNTVQGAIIVVRGASCARRITW